MGSFVCFGLDNHDIWWALACGRLIWTTGVIPTRDVFSYLTEGRPWVDDSWLYQVVVYGVWRALGEQGLVVGKVIWAVGLVLSVGAVLRGRGAPWSIICLASVPAVFVFAPRCLLRPELISYGCLCFTLLILPRGTDPPKRAALIALPLLQIVWVNGHIGFPLGPAVVMLTALGQVLNTLWCRDRRSCRPLQDSLSRHALLLALLTVASLANPYGWRMLLEPFRMLGSEVFTQGISEWRPVWQGDTWIERWGPPALAVIASLGFLRARRPDAVHLVWLGAFFFLAMRSIRHAPLFALVALIVMAEVWGSNLSGGIGRRPRLSTRLTCITGGILTALIALTLTGWTWHALGYHRRPGLSAPPWRFPTACVEFLRSHIPEGQGFHTYATGGLLMWHLHPEKRVAIDGRLIVHGEEMFQEVSEIAHGVRARQPFFDRHGVHWALIDLQIRPLAQALWESPDWHLVCLGPAGVVFVEAIPEHREMIARFEIKSEDLDVFAVVDMPRRRTLLPPAPPGMLITRSVALLNFGRPDLAHRLTARALGAGFTSDALVSLRAESLNRLAREAAETGRLEKAEDHLREVVRLDPASAGAWNNLGSVLALQGDVAGAQAAWQRALRLDPGHAQARENLQRFGEGVR